MADLLTTGYQTNKLYKHSGFSATISASLAITGAISVVWKDPDVYFANTNYNSMKKGTGFTATVASSFAFSGAVDVDFAGDDLLRVFDSTKIYKHTGFTATITSSFTVTGASFRGVCWDGTNVIGSNKDFATTPKIVKFSGFSSSITNSFASGTLPKGISWDGTNLISTQGNNKYRLHTGFSSTITSSIAVESGNTDPYGMDWDGFPSAGSSSIKTINGLALASVKTVNGLGISSVKTVNGLA